VKQWTQVRTAEDVMLTLQRVGVPAGKVQDARDLLQDPHIAYRGHYVYLDHPEDGHRVYDGMHEHLSETPGAVRGPAPLLGEANEYVFRDLLGLGEEEINQGYIEGLFS